MKRYGCDADLGVVMRAWFLRIFHDATSGRKGFCVLCSHLFHEKKQGSELSPEPCSETGGEGGILKRAQDKGLRRGFRKRTTKRTTGEKKCFYRVFLLVALRESLATRLRNSRSAAIGYAVIPG